MTSRNRGCSFDGRLAYNLAMDLNVIVLAAGEGKRMRSSLPKVLHPLAGKPLIEHVVGTARTLAPARIFVVYGHRGHELRGALADLDVAWIEQAERLGTGHAVQQVLPAIPGESLALVLYADVPMIGRGTLDRLIGLAAADGLALVSTRLANPSGYGRIVRDRDGNVARIVEHRDADAAERAIDEVNTGILAARAGDLARWLSRLDNRNSQSEYYLTDVIGQAVGEGRTVRSVEPASSDEVLGINDRAQLAAAERLWQRRAAERLMGAGVTLLDPARFDLRGELSAGVDVVIDVNVVLEGSVTLGDGVYVGPNCVLRDARVGQGTRVEANCVVERAEIGPHCRIGPFTRLRPETVIGEQAHLGNFVEIKKASVGKGSKINHLSYIGDARVGEGVNIGAGTITCNYDGVNKHPTTIGDGAFIGSDTQLVAPVTVGAGAYIGAGSTITRDAPPGELTLSRAPQETRKGWKRKRKTSKGQAGGV
jgi:bifunctional UDP-N-acetylglucosamine pyrophosphorylase/glucosamine-1-phosphate N-acetyltransferase